MITVSTGGNFIDVGAGSDSVTITVGDYWEAG
jgi:precorrin-6B methylase 2